MQLLVLQPQTHAFFRNHLLPFHSHSDVSQTFLRPRLVDTQSKLELQLINKLQHACFVLIFYSTVLNYWLPML